jgi:hypothetical protein
MALPLEFVIETDIDLFSLEKGIISIFRVAAMKFIHASCFSWKPGSSPAQVTPALTVYRTML